MNKRHVAVLMGGMSSEHDVSMVSGGKVARSLDRAHYDVTPVTISKHGMWSFPDANDLNLHEALHRLSALRVDCVFLALHGAFGEDGRVQGMLDLSGLPYTGSGCAASALALDKVRSKAIVSDAGFDVAPHQVIEKTQWDAHRGQIMEQLIAMTGIPCAVKSPCQGSSLGMGIPQTEDELPEVMDRVFTFGDIAMVEAFVTGRELTCGVLDVAGEAPRALPVTEIIPVDASFFDYGAKYTPGATEEVTPARLPRALTQRIQEIALAIHQAIGCEGWSRSDFILRDGEPVWLEVNTIPGMTETSLFPQAAAAAGITYSELLGILVEDGISRGKR